MLGIYCIENTNNGKKYFGQSIDVKRRIRRHRYDLRHNKHINRHLQNAWNKYGEKSFAFNLISLCDNLNEMNKMEIELIKRFNTVEEGYNKTPGGESGHTSFLGRKHSPESIEKMRLAKIGKKMSSETILKMKKNAGRGFQGRKHTEESKKKMSEALKGRKISKSTREAVRKANTGLVRSPETRKKMSESQMGRVVTEEQKRKISEKKRFQFTDEQKKEIQERLNNGESYRSVAKDFNCTHMTISRYFKKQNGDD